jgi:hypothetical protein
MASPVRNQASLVVLRAHVVHRLPEPPVNDERRPLTPKYPAHISKYAAILRQQPYNMARAVAHLEAWVCGPLHVGDILHARCQGCVAGHGSCRACPVQQSSGSCRGCPVRRHIRGLPGVVSLGRVPRRRPQPEAGGFSDPRAAVVYSCALALFNAHPGISLKDAIEMGEQCWRRTAHAAVPQALLVARSGSNALVWVAFAVEAAELSGDDVGGPLDVEAQPPRSKHVH